MKAALTQGAYSARSIAANAQRCINLFPEPNPADSPFPTTHYPAPGLRLLGTAPTGTGWRCLYRTKSTGELFGVCGSTVFQISATWTFTTLGTIATSSGIASMSDDGFFVLLVDGTAAGYTITLTSKAFATISDPNFYGATRVDIADTYFVLNRPGTNNWYISLTNDDTFNALDIASKTSNPDPLKSVIVVGDNVVLPGALTTEIWYNTGASDFTFGKVPGAFIEHGCAAAYSVAKYELNGYWLSQNEAGQYIVLKYNSLAAQRISTHAIEAEISSYGDVSDAIGFCFQMGGHPFYQLTFPSADKTWVWDESSKLWHQRVSLDSNGAWHRHPANCTAFVFNTNVCGDHASGNLYAFDLNAYTENGSPILYLRSWPHMLAEGKRVSYRTFIADMEAGTDADTTTDNPPLVSLRWSDDRGNSWGNAVTMPLGSAGQYDTSLQWWGLGMARDRVFELSWSAPVKTALNGAFVDTLVHRT